MYCGGIFPQSAAGLGKFLSGRYQKRGLLAIPDHAALRQGWLLPA
jgi:hypothetical protein